jgi:hypothetical protein
VGRQAQALGVSAANPTAMLAAARCACGSQAIVAVRPGLDPLRRGAIDLFSRADPLVEGRPDAVWCRACWVTRWGAR